MTDIDPQADIEVHSADEHVTVRVPLASPVTGEWLRCYQKLALAKGVPVQAQVHDDRAWLVERAGQQQPGGSGGDAGCCPGPAC